MEPVEPFIPPHLVPPGSRPCLIGATQPEFITLPSIRTPTGLVITRWKLTEQEKQLVADGVDIYITIRNSGDLHPMRPTVGLEDWR